MKAKWVVFAVVAAFLFLIFSPRSMAVDTRAVDAIRGKGVLSNEDLQAIDDFLGEGVNELVMAQKFTDIARLRTVILSRQSSQKQYAQQFSESAYKHLMSGLQSALRLPEDRAVKVTVNLLILIDGLADLRLADLSVAMLKSKSAVVRYWAVHSLSNPAIVAKLNAGGQGTAQRARIIAEKLRELVDSSEPETTALLVRFAGAVKSPQATDLLLRIADRRIKEYAGWRVKYELLDGMVLKMLAGKLQPPAGSAGSSQEALCYRFGQLYSFAIQRYIAGKGYLSDIQRQQLASVLVGTEEKCIGKLLGKPQTSIKRAVERSDDRALWAEHDRVLGSAAQAGALSSKISFMYGPDSDGKKHKGPFALPKPGSPSR